jgi:hypothetical protein
VNNFKSQAERVSTVDAYPEEYWDVTEEDEIDPCPWADYSEEDWEKALADNLDENYPEVVIGNYTFNPSDILRQLDPIAFEMEALNYQDWCLGDCLCEKHDL